ncbi:Hypothetical cytosolic protein [Lactobacillus helveticus CIRM-BIA 104]|uniref:Hypothetical cytosolic protein n=1 Tax=Lactobacillus helveticus CIRM-BIA 104 TaxID=1226333 RepID=U6FAM2_LACHE|nr:Hypothetical cytosolic protein [Lactobacillus helveticus CIRM-BIA 104]
MFLPESKSCPIPDSCYPLKSNRIGADCALTHAAAACHAGMPGSCLNE